MRPFACQHCGHLVFFDNTRCLSCASPLGFLPDERELVVLAEAEGAQFTARFAADGRRYWRCLNAAWKCNWMVPADGAETWCASCRLTRGRPDETDVDAVQAWMDAEAAKRLLVFQLGELGLPVAARSDGVPDGLAFDLVFVPGATSVTGHRDGIVTIDLTESDDAHREQLRKELGESYRTLLGHLRHEVGHYYWPGLVERTGWVSAFRDLFGDERIDYDLAMKRHYGAQPSADWAEHHVSAYAASHPWEDWAETFAHYIHIRDTLQTATSFGIRMTDPQIARPRAVAGVSSTPTAPVPDPSDFTAILAEWLPLTYALNAVNRSMGHDDLYPFVLSPTVMRKLAFVHDRVSGR